MIMFVDDDDNDDDADDDQLIMSVAVSDGVAASVRGLWWIHTEDDTRRFPWVRLCSNILQADDFTGHSHTDSYFLISEQHKPFNKSSCFLQNLSFNFEIYALSYIQILETCSDHWL